MNTKGEERNSKRGLISPECFANNKNASIFTKIFNF